MRKWIHFPIVLLLSSMAVLLFCSLHPAPGSVTLQHTLPDRILNEEEKEFSLSLSKGSISGPARIRIEIRQSGMEISGIELAGAEILREGDVHSVVWTDLPSSSTIDLRLKIKAHKFFTGIYTAKISFSYLEGGSSKETQLASQDIRMSSSGKSYAAGSTGTGTSTGTSTGTGTGTGTGTSTGTGTGNSNLSTVQNQGQSRTMIDPITKKQGTPIVDASTIPGLFFRVQVAASHFLVTQEYFKDRYKFDEQLYVDKVDGWIKYTIGDFKSVEDALAKKATLSAFPFKGPFLVAFNDGKRIPLFTARQMSSYK